MSNEITRSDLLKTKLKETDPVIKNLLSVIVGEFDSSASTKTPLTLLDVILKLKKSNDSSLAIISEDHPTYDQLINENNFLETLLPKPLTEEDIEEIIKNMINRGLSDKKSIMSEMKLNYAGRFNGKVVSDIFDELKR